MTNSFGSYDVTRFQHLTTLMREVARLDRNVPDTSQLRATIETLGLRPDAHIVEIGSGSGINALALAKARPGGKLTAVDISADLLAVVEGRAQDAGCTNLVTSHQDALELTLEHPADLILARLIFQHVPDVGKLATKLRSQLAPGGVLLVQEWGWSDFGISEATREWRSMLERIVDAMAAQGGHPDIGRVLPPALVRAGFGEVKVQGRYCTSRLKGQCDAALTAIRFLPDDEQADAEAVLRQLFEPERGLILFSYGMAYEITPVIPRSHSEAPI